jgi:hypothetical protein
MVIEITQIRCRFRKASAGAKAGNVSGFGSGGSKSANERRQQGQAQYIGDDHAEAGDNAKLGQATISGRGERQKSSCRRPGRQGKGDANPSC